MRKPATALLILALLLSPAVMKAADSAAALYNQGNALYQAGKFAEARDAYRQARAAGVQNADLEYNLGNAELRAGRLGPAIACYLRAQRLNPGDADLRFNLEYARNKITPKLPSPPAGPLSKPFNLLGDLLSANGWTAAAVIAFWLLALSIVGLILSRTPVIRAAVRTCFYLTLVVFVLVAPVAGVRVKRDYFTPRAVIVAAKVSARSGPGEDNAALFDLSQGMDVAVGQCERGWCRVSAAGGFIGWTPAESFERL